jgi:hypothetical protein
VRAQELANAAFGDMEDKDSSPFGGAGDEGPDPELVAYMSKFLKAAALKDTKGMARAFKGAAEACDYDKSDE